MRYLSIISILFILTGRPCLAESNNYFWKLGLHTGGDKVPPEEISASHPSTIEAGGLVSGSLGFNFQLYNNFYITPSFGLKHNTNLVKLDSFSRTRWKVYMLDLPITYRNDNLRFGFGFTYHHKPTLTIQTEEYSEVWRFEDSIGTIIQLDYYYDTDATIGLHYTDIDYTMPGIRPVSGDNIGLIWRFYF